MWIHFWWREHGCKEPNSKYEWLEKDYSSDVLKDMARDTVPHWAEEDGFDYGFELIKRPPKEALERMLKNYKQEVKYAQYMVDIIAKELVLE